MSKRSKYFIVIQTGITKNTYLEYDEAILDVNKKRILYRKSKEKNIKESAYITEPTDISYQFHTWYEVFINMGNIFGNKEMDYCVEVKALSKRQVDEYLFLEKL